MMHRAFLRSVVLLVVGAVSASRAPCQDSTTSAMDSAGMPPLDLLAREAGRDSRRHPIGAVARALLCAPTHPLVDSASLAACASLDSVRAAVITAAFARGLEVPLAAATDTGDASGVPTCPADLERVAGPRVLLARVIAPVAGVREGRWEGRFAVEIRCRSPDGGAIRTMAKEYLYQWDGRAWRLYQFAWLRA